jgi:hypothetical protein
VEKELSTTLEVLNFLEISYRTSMPGIATPDPLDAAQEEFLGKIRICAGCGNGGLIHSFGVAESAVLLNYRGQKRPHSRYSKAMA